MSNASSSGGSGNSSAQPKWCVAPNEVNDKFNQVKGGGYLFELKPGEQGVFPHVDTCAGLIFRTKDDRTFIYHASQTPKSQLVLPPKDQNLDQLQSMQEAFGEVQGFTGPNNFESVTSIGPSDWRGPLKGFFNNGTHISTDNYSKGVDVEIQSDGSFSVKPCK